MEIPEVTPAHILDLTACERRTRRLGAIMTIPFGVRLDPETSQRWMEIVSLFRITDNFLDNFSNGTLEERTETVLQYIEDPRAYAQWFPTLSPEHLSEDTYKEVQFHASKIVRLNKHLKTTDSPQRYISLRRAEGRASARMLVALASEEMRTQRHFGRFEVGMDMMGETINLMDSFLDATEDADKGEIQFKPNVQFRARLLGATARIAAGYLPAIISQHDQI